MADLKIPNNDRIRNRFAVVDPDKTILNAENVMAIFDNLVNGKYPIKPAKVYETYEDLQAETILEMGQSAYVKQNPDKLYIYNGTRWVVLSGGGGSSNVVVMSDTEPTDLDTLIWIDTSVPVIVGSQLITSNGLRFLTSLNQPFILSESTVVGLPLLTADDEEFITSDNDTFLVLPE